jgi:hypothetical protein
MLGTKPAPPKSSCRAAPPLISWWLACIWMLRYPQPQPESASWRP